MRSCATARPAWTLSSRSRGGAASRRGRSMTDCSKSVDRAVESVRREFEVPGIAVAVIKDGEVIVVKGYGVRKLGHPAPVTPQTLFPIASNSKAFTTAALAIL